MVTFPAQGLRENLKKETINWNSWGGGRCVSACPPHTSGVCGPSCPLTLSSPVQLPCYPELQPLNCFQTLPKGPSLISLLSACAALAQLGGWLHSLFPAASPQLFPYCWILSLLGGVLMWCHLSIPFPVTEKSGWWMVWAFCLAAAHPAHLFLEEVSLPGLQGFSFCCIGRLFPPWALPQKGSPVLFSLSPWDSYLYVLTTFFLSHDWQASTGYVTSSY